MYAKTVLFVLLMAIGGAAQNTCDQLVPKALELYGCMDSLNSFPGQINQQISARMAQDQRMSAAEKQKFADTVLNSIQVDRLVKNVQTDVIASCNAGEMKSLVDQLKTPLVQKMRGFESIGNSPEGAQKLAAHLQLPEVQSPQEKRSALIRELVDVTGVVDSMVDTVVETSRSMLEGMGAPPPKPEQLDQMRSQIHDRAAEQMRQMMLAVYHDAADEELVQYVALLKTPVFQHFNQSFSKAMIRGFGTEMRFAGQALRKMADEQKAAEKPVQP